MPFKRINVSEVIEEKRNSDKEFKEAWDASQMEYELIRQLVALRKEQELSQGELASKMHKSQQSVSRVENNEINPSLRVVCNMAHALGYELKLVPKTAE